MLVIDFGALHTGRCKELRDGAYQTIAKRHLKVLRNFDILKSMLYGISFGTHGTFIITCNPKEF